MARKYIYGPGIDNPVAMVHVDGQNETWYYYYTDALGSVRLITDTAGDVVESYTYDVYGTPVIMTTAGDGNWLREDSNAIIVSSSSISNPIMFTGRWWDSTTQLYYYRARDYSPDLGRFLQPDPAGYIDTMNLYAYVNNNPLNWIDPWGLKSEGFWDKVGDMFTSALDFFSNLFGITTHKGSTTIPAAAAAALGSGANSISKQHAAWNDAASGWGPGTGFDDDNQFKSAHKIGPNGKTVYVGDGNENSGCGK